MITPSSSADLSPSTTKTSPQLTISSVTPRRSRSPLHSPIRHTIDAHIHSSALPLNNFSHLNLNSTIIQRPSPVVPSHPASPTASRSSSPSRSRRVTGGGSVVELDNELRNHIFERDFEFNHPLGPSEAIDVSVPPALVGAALTLSLSDSMDNEEFNNIVRSHTGETGWESPAMGKQFNFGTIHSPSRSPSASRDIINSGSSRKLGSPTLVSPSGTREERDGVGNRSRSSSPAPIDSLAHRLCERSLSNLSMSSISNQDKLPSTLPSQYHLTLPEFPAPLSFPLQSHSALHSPTTESEKPQWQQKEGIAPPIKSLDKLSFLSYADLVNEERLAELTGAARGDSI